MTTRVESTLGDTVEEAKVLLAHTSLDGSRSRHISERQRRKVTTDAVGVVHRAVARAQVGLETSKGPDLETATARAVGDVPGGVDGQTGLGVGEVSRDPGSVSTEAVLVVKDGRVEEHRCVVIWACGIEGPVPVGDATLPATCLKLLLIGVHQEAVVRVEGALLRLEHVLRMVNVTEYVPQSAHHQH